MPAFSLSSRSRRSSGRGGGTAKPVGGGNLLASFALLQFGLGIVTILSGASIYIAWAHQGGAMVHSAAIWRWRKPVKTEA